MNENLIKVAAGSRSSAVAGAIAGVMREHRHAEVQAIGAAAVNQAVKALAITGNYLKDDGMALFCSPRFLQIEIDEKRCTAVRFDIETHS